MRFRDVNQSTQFNTCLSGRIEVMSEDKSAENSEVSGERRSVGRPTKDVERFTTTINREVLVWAKGHLGERGIGPWITSKLMEERERVEAAEALAEKRARSKGRE